MKKILFLLSAVILLFTSCEGPAGRDGFDGEDTKWFVKTYTIRTGDWQLVNGVDALNSYYKAEVIIPELSRFVYEKGNVFCYMFQEIDGTEVQTLLPFSLPIGIESKGGEEIWTETYACDFTPGSIMFYVNHSDFYTGRGRPGTTSFRVVLNW